VCVYVAFTNIRGGHNYPWLVRNTTRKPIRVFLQDGSNDLNNQHGSWPLANQEMHVALKYAGYDVKFEWGEGNHSGKSVYVEPSGGMFPFRSRFNSEFFSFTTDHKSKRPDDNIFLETNCVQEPTVHLFCPTRCAGSGVHRLLRSSDVMCAWRLSESVCTPMPTP